MDEKKAPASNISVTQEELDEIKSIVEKFKDNLIEKFKDYVLTVSLQPPGEDKEKINVLVLIDDAEDDKLTNKELRKKLEGVVQKKAESISERLNVNTRLISDVWQDYYDGNSEKTQEVVQSAPVYDSGMLSALKVTDVHKRMVLDRFEKYIVSYVLAGSLVQGKATPESDIDVFLVIDDTDVKKMSRAELKDKLRAIIVGMASEASQAVGVKNKLNVQVYILTDFWDMIKQANPIIFTFLRDGVPLYDRGIFMAWKQLLKMGRIKPSPEAIDMFMNTGSQMMKKVNKKLKEIAMEDFFWATITSSQAAIMLYGLPPPTPKETPNVLQDIFVEKEGFLDKEDIETVKEVLKIRKDLEHGKRKNVKGEDIDHLVKITQAYLEKSQKLFSEIQDLKTDDRFLTMVEDVESSINIVLTTEDVDQEEFDSVEDALEKEFVVPGKLPARVVRDVKSIFEAKEKYEDGDLPKAEINNVVRKGRQISRMLLEYSQRKKAQDKDSYKIRITFGEDSHGEILFLGDGGVLTTYHGEDYENHLFTLGEDGSIDEINEVEEEKAEAYVEEQNLRRTEVGKKLIEGLETYLDDDVKLHI